MWVKFKDFNGNEKIKKWKKKDGNDSFMGHWYFMQNLITYFPRTFVMKDVKMNGELKLIPNQRCQMKLHALCNLSAPSGAKRAI